MTSEAVRLGSQGVPSIDKVICIGKNYEAHAKELGDAVPEKPVLFLKPACSIIQCVGSSPLIAPVPRGRGSLHHECEIVVRLNAQGGITHFTLGLDMTLRDLQATLKKAGHPWEVSKVFAGAALVGEWIEAFYLPEFIECDFELKVNGKRRQLGRASDMLFTIEQCIVHAKEYFPIRDGDLVFTGTPEGVGPIVVGDEAEAVWDGRKLLGVRWG